MSFTREQALFDNRYDAGRQLAAQLGEYKGQPVVVLAIPNGGVPVGVEVAAALEVELDLVISRKIPLPLTPEAGFGALADDGTVILNEELVKAVGLTPDQINFQINRVRGEIRQRSLLYRRDRPSATVSGKTVIITDDGLASGFTMIAAVESVRRRQPKEVIVAVPVASATALEQLEKVGAKVVTVAVGTKPRFFVADFYRYWHDLSEDEVIKCLKEFRMRRFDLNVKPPENGSVVRHDSKN
ncbi:MAG: phosphoribosyl transferase [Chloroflexi bacterium]|nr:phosphoribosyl transferase [Chloroflexota bacterium]MBI2980442.1 phosphoribosyl transferase [Chloroflexota bacterium]